MIETLLLEIGSTVSGVILRLWLQNSEVARSATAEVDELIERFVPGSREQRTLRRDLERISEQIADRLEPFFESEFDGLPENEKIAAGLLVRDTLAGAPLSDALLFATDLEPVALEAEVRRAAPAAAEEAFLSAAGTVFYDQLLREITNYVVEIRIALPDFGSQAARVILQRETELIELVTTILDRLPAQESGLDSGQVAAFEAQYRRDVARKLDQLELFGVTTSEVRSRYSLSVAYLTLTASARLDRLALKQADAERRGAEEGDEEDRASIPVDDALGRCSRVLVRGEAGSGKTTLLRWLAVNCARGSFEGELSGWNGSVPFLLPLRRFVRGNLPPIPDFATAINQHAITPDGWVWDRLRAGTAIVLVDGIDELPEEKREAAHEWLSDLVATYPEAKYVVTSRPPAVSEDWLDGEGFESVVLESMGVSAIGAFVDHWHEAVADSVSDVDEAGELEELATDLKERVRATRSIRNLASSPLLCAMLCALNRDRRAQIPSDRIELYRIALEMLLERRDAERRVIAGIPNLGMREKEILLRVFALWLLNNSRSDATIEDLTALIEDRLPGMVRVEASAVEVTKNLLLRSGLLREPIEGRVDFIHRTFQEYLAAKEAVETRSVGMLLEHAHHDQWQEVVVLAAGLASLPMREELIAGLIKRGNREQRFKHRLHLLAVNCLETSAELSPDLTQRVDALLERLVPPRSLTEAKAIASAGDLATPLLGRHAAGSKAAEAAACVRALSLIGDESALVQLEKFGPDGRVTVARELVRGWQEFPGTEYAYASRVLRESPLDRGGIEVSSPAELEDVGVMRKARSLVVNGGSVTVPAGKWPWEAIAGHQALAQIELLNMLNMVEVPPLSGVPSLSALRLGLATEVERIGVGDLPDVERLAINLALSLTDASGIGALENLRLLWLTGAEHLRQLPRLPASLERVFLSKLGISDLAALDGCDPLQVLSVLGCPRLVNVDAVGRHSELVVLLIEDAPAVADIHRIGEIRGLQVLGLRNSGDMTNVAVLGECVDLVHLAIEDSARLSDVGWLESLTELEELSLSGCAQLEHFPAIELPNLRVLHLTGSTGISDLGWVTGLPALEALYIDGCARIDDLAPLRELPNLHLLSLCNCDKIRDASVLMELPSLGLVDARGCSFEVDLDALELERDVFVRTGPAARLSTRSPVGSEWTRLGGWFGP